jgi:hypothetical protein
LLPDAKPLPRRILPPAAQHYDVGSAAGAMRKSFLLPFFKKEALLSFSD